MAISVAMLAGIAASQITHTDFAALSAAGAWAAPPAGCSVTQVHLTPSLLYSAEARGYVVSAITFDEVPPGCVGQEYRLALVTADGASVLETTAVMEEENHQVTIPSADRPRADVVATTVLSMGTESRPLPDDVAQLP